MRNRVLLSIIFHFAFGIVCVHEAKSDTQCEKPSESLTYLGNFCEPNTVLNGTNSTKDIYNCSDAATIVYRRLRIEVSPKDAKNWRLTIRNIHFIPQAFIGPEDMEIEGNTAFLWTGKLFTEKPDDPLIASADWLGDAADTKIKISKALEMDAGIAGGHVMYSVVDAEHKRIIAIEDDAIAPSPPSNVYERSVLRKLGDNVALLSAFGPDRDGKLLSWCCTGVFLSPELVLTNWHCGAADSFDFEENSYWKKSNPCKNFFIDGSWDSDSVRREYSCRRVEAADKKLDFALLRVAGVLGAGNPAGNVGQIRIAAGPASAGENLIVVHHAACGKKAVSSFLTAPSDCKVIEESRAGWVNSKETELSHRCDTERGSSGAPIFNHAGELVALHHGGFSFPVAGSCESDRLNKAVKIQEILEKIREQDTSVYQEIINSSQMN